MPRYQIEMNGQKFEVEAPDDQSLSLAISKMQQPARQADARNTSGIRSFVQGAADIASFGLSDEIAAGLGYLGGKLPGGHGEGYGELLSDIRAQQEADAEAHPIAHTAGMVAGGVGSGLGLAKGGLSMAAKLAPNASRLTRVAVGAGEGAAAGGVYGVGSGEGVGGRIAEGAKDALIGGVVGGLFPLAAEGVGKGYRAIANSRAAKDIAAKAGAKPETLRMLGDTFAADGTLGPVGARNIRAAGADAMLADAGPNARKILDTAIQRGGPGAIKANDAIAARASRGQRSVMRALDTALGNPKGVIATQNAIRQGTAGARKSAYDLAYDMPINYSDPRGMALEEIIKGRVPGRVIAEANELMRIGGDKSRQILAKIADDGSVTYERLPDVRQLDYITRALNQVAESGDGAGALGGQTTKGRAYSDLSREIRSTLRDLVPEYGQALDTAADPIRRSQAVKFGSKLLSSATTRDEVSEAVKGMSQAEKDAVAQGVRSRIDDALANVARTVQDGDTPAREAIKAIKELSSRANREKLATVIGDEKAGALFREMDRVARSFDLRASVAENSKTYARQATERRIGEMTGPNFLETAAEGEPLNATKRVVQAITGHTPEYRRAREDAIYSQLADLLTRSASEARPLFSSINQLAQVDASTQMTVNRIARALQQAQPATVYPATGLLADRTRFQ